MAFLRTSGDSGVGRISGHGVFLRQPELGDYAAWSALRGESRAFLQPWEPAWAEDELSRTSYRYKMRRYIDDVREGRAYAFFVFLADETLIGGATLSRVHRGVSQSCALGYWAGQRFAGKGLMSAAVRALLRFSFEDLSLHRVEAAVQPDNAASRRLLEAVGFQEEGFARQYLKIAGEWRDHVLYAFLSTDPVAPPKTRSASL